MCVYWLPPEYFYEIDDENQSEENQMYKAIENRPMGFHAKQLLPNSTQEALLELSLYGNVVFKLPSEMNVEMPVHLNPSPINISNDINERSNDTKIIQINESPESSKILVNEKPAKSEVLIKLISKTNRIQVKPLDNFEL
ncbi:9840_t:CDS:2, partial [Racocetra fulgida]